MKKFSVVSIALFVIFTISGLNSTCTGDFERCLNHTDCCSGKCLMTGYIHNRICLETSSIDQTKIQKGKCSYYKPEDEKLDRHMSQSFGLFASHPLLPTNSMVEVKHNDKVITVRITHQYVENKNNSILELSRDAAKELGIETEGLFDCNLQLVTSEVDYYPLLKPIGIIIFYVTAMFLIV
ncbi:uncharacterized protein LOC132922903 [Rhopalosiphum padi]|uniref:uncharacterized protein LOC132922903 n=1 Tax=Rhopalosiphum padi TaxID=40932 RepID=UPI00298EC97B|nr:uncharacterized protein LOC132922903 [Rhopalosiphum padi]